MPPETEDETRLSRQIKQLEIFIMAQGTSQHLTSAQFSKQSGVFPFTLQTLLLTCVLILSCFCQPHQLLV